MTVEHELDSLIQRMQDNLHNDASYIENYKQTKTDRSTQRSRPRRSSSEESRYNRDQWYAMGTPQPTSSQNPPQPLTPILKRRDPLSPDCNKVRKTLNFSLESDQTPVSGYESDFRSPSPRPVSPFQSQVSKSDYYRHKDASHKKPLPGHNQYMGSSWPHRLDQIDDHRPLASPHTLSQQDQTHARTGYGKDGTDFARPSSACSFEADAGLGGQWPFLGGSEQNLARLVDDEPATSLSDSCQDIDRKGRFTNLPSNWEKSIAFFEQKKEQLPAQRVKSVEPLNAYVGREQVKMTESTPNLVARLAQEANEIPAWMQQLKHIVIEQMPLPAPPRFGTLLHGRRNADWSLAPPINGPPCHLCHQPITESRCIRSDEHNFHCWHFVCSFCNKTLPEFDFTMAPDNRPYCLNCFKRYFP